MSIVCVGWPSVFSATCANSGSRSDCIPTTSTASSGASSPANHCRNETASQPVLRKRQRMPLFIPHRKRKKPCAARADRALLQMAPWKGIEPLSTAPEAVALSIGLPGRKSAHITESAHIVKTGLDAILPVTPTDPWQQALSHTDSAPPNTLPLRQTPPCTTV